GQLSDYRTCAVSLVGQQEYAGRDRTRVDYPSYQSLGCDDRVIFVHAGCRSAVDDDGTEPLAWVAGDDSCDRCRVALRGLPLAERAPLISQPKLLLRPKQSGLQVLFLSAQLLSLDSRIAECQIVTPTAADSR